MKPSRPWIPPKEEKEPSDRQGASQPKKLLCPSCSSDLYSIYANGDWQEGYCQNCSLETKVPSKEIINIRKVNVSRPKPKPSKKEW